MITAIVVTFITGVFSLLGGTILVLIKRAFAFKDLEKSLVDVLDRIDKKNNDTLGRIEDKVEEMKKTFTEHSTSVRLCGELCKVQRTQLAKDVEEVKDIVNNN